MNRFCLPAVLSLLCSAALAARNSDSFIINFRPVYIVTGFSLEKPSSLEETASMGADVKFQFSFGIPLWKNIGGKENFDMFIGYTQGCIWDFYGKSSPMRDNMFAPGLYFNLPLYKSNLLFGIEHRSNGRPFMKSASESLAPDGYSRSLNHLLTEFTYSFDFGLTLQANLRGGYGWYGEDLSQDIYYKFFGYSTISGLYETPGKILGIALSATPTFEPFNCILDAEITVRPFKKDYLPVFLIQYHQGWDSAMCDWVRSESAPSPSIRFGIMFSPRATPFRLSR